MDNMLKTNLANISSTLSTLSVDCVIFGLADDKLKVLLTKHESGINVGQWALPGDYINQDIDLENMPYEVLAKSTGLRNVYVEQFDVFGRTGRVPHQRVITIAYFALINIDRYIDQVGKGTRVTMWESLDKIPKLIYDHDEVIQKAYETLKIKLRREPIGVELLSEQFSLTQFQSMYETILGIKLDPRNFRKKVAKEKLLKATGTYAENVPYRSPALYSFDKERIEELRRGVYYFDI
jgi:hypothetical protein